VYASLEETTLKEIINNQSIIQFNPIKTLLKQINKTKKLLKPVFQMIIMLTSKI